MPSNFDRNSEKDMEQLKSSENDGMIIIGSSRQQKDYQEHHEYEHVEEQLESEFDKNVEYQIDQK